MKVLVLGGGVFGCNIATELADAGAGVTLVESSSVLMGEASKANHNRVHFGYHYPRSVPTANQCIESLPSFLLHYGQSVITGFPNYYAIAANGSYVTPKQYTDFCDQIGISYAEEMPPNNLLDPSKLAASYRVNEPIFDYNVLKELTVRRLEKSSAEVILNAQVEKVHKSMKGGYTVSLDGKTQHFDKVINCTYASLNNVNKLFGVRPRELRFEKMFIAVFEMPHDPVGLTVMDGPFCTIMPQGSNKNRFMLCHVDGSIMSNSTDVNNIEPGAATETDTARVYRMSQEYMPFLSSVEHVDALMAQKAVYENKFDARVSDVAMYDDAPDFMSVLSGKIMCALRISYQIRDYLLKGDTQGGKIL